MRFEATRYLKPRRLQDQRAVCKTNRAVCKTVEHILSPTSYTKLMLSSRMPSPGDPGGRKFQLAEALLAKRLGKFQLAGLLEKLGAPEDVWEDSFKASTARDVPKSDEFDQETFQLNLQELGLTEDFAQLSDDTVWTRHERALYRLMAHLADPERAEEAAPEPRNPEAFFQVLDSHFEKWDRNGDLRLDDTELDLIMSGGHFGECRPQADDVDSASTLVTLRRYRGLIQSLEPTDGEGVSSQDIRRLQSPETVAHKEIHNIVLDEFEAYIDKSKRIESKSLFDENIEPFAIHQGTAGSCVLLSTAAGLEPVDLLEKFRELPDHQFEVQFSGQTEVVGEPTLAERLYHSKGEDMERWPALLEIAMAQKLYVEEPGKYDSLRDAVDGIEPEVAIKALTGLETDKRNLDELSVNGTRDALEELVTRDGPKICGSRPTANGDFISVEDLHNGILTGHCYTILGFDSEKDTVTLRNPWGHGEWNYQESPDEGIFDMPLRDFYSSFRWIASVEEPQA